MTPFDYIENAGIVRTTLHGMYSYGIARWLIERHRESVEIDWERLERKERLGTHLPGLIPLLDEDSLTEANIPYIAWIHAAKDQNMSDLQWLIDRLEGSSLSEKERSRFYDSLELWIRWDMGEAQSSRTRNIRATRRIFYHRGPLIRRSEVSLDRAMSSPLPLEKLSLNDGKVCSIVSRPTAQVSRVVNHRLRDRDRRSSDAGVEGIFLWCLPAERRLPPRGITRASKLKTAFRSLHEANHVRRMERVYTFYTFGRTALFYSKVLRALIM